MSTGAGTHRIPIAELKRLHRHAWLPNLKIPLFDGLLVAAGVGAWTTPSPVVRRVLDGIMGDLGMGIVLFCAYILIGGLLTIGQFTFIDAFQHFDRRRWLIHGAELLLRVAVIGGLLALSSHHAVLGRVLAIWLIPAFLFTLLDSVRFIAEHYETPWDEGQLLGTRTIVRSRANRFFWNDINDHIGHHVHPGVPWYNLKKLHLPLRP